MSNLSSRTGCGIQKKQGSNPCKIWHIWRIGPMKIWFCLMAVIGTCVLFRTRRSSMISRSSSAENIWPIRRICPIGPMIRWSKQRAAAVRISLAPWDKPMYYTYILQSRKDNMLYVGFTPDLKNRYEQHSKGKVASTKYRIPFDLIYYEACRSKTDALHREKYLKSSWGKRYIKNRLKNDDEKK